MNNELYHYGIKGQKWGVRRDKEINRAKWNRGKKLYEKGRTITTNLDRRSPIKNVTRLAAGISTVATPIALTYYMPKMRNSANPIISALGHTPIWAIPVSGLVSNAAIRAIGRLAQIPYDIQDSDMRYYYNRRSE